MASANIFFLFNNAGYACKSAGRQTGIPLQREANLLYIYFKRGSIFLKNKREDGNFSTLPQVP